MAPGPMLRPGVKQDCKGNNAGKRRKKGVTMSPVVVSYFESYNQTMSIFVKTTPVQKPRTVDAARIAYFYAFILVVFALAQLFTFDDFVRLLESFVSPSKAPIADLLSGVIVVGEIFALPFLLGMSVSPLMRVVSMGFSWLVPAIWFKLSLLLVLSTNVIHNVGFLGTKVSLEPGWWAVFFSIALGMLAAWAGWGLWPGKRK